MGLFKSFFISLLILSSCSGSQDLAESSEELIIEDTENEIDYRNEMRSFVISISEYAKENQNNFIVIPQNGIELVTENGDYTASQSIDYLNAIDANGQESLFYGYSSDDEKTPIETSDYTTNLLNVSKANGNSILVTDYCYSTEKIADSYSKNEALGYVSLAATVRDLNVIPNESIHNENDLDIVAIQDAQNFLYLLNLENFSNKSEFITAVSNTNYDAIIMDLFFNDGTEFTQEEIASLKTKANGGKRLVISYMSIGEAEDYRYYWDSSWNTITPEWLAEENSNWPGNFKVKYWLPEWQNIIFGSDNSYLNKILSVQYDGVYLDIIDGFEYFEN